jgi:OPA family glycerol-3-phosphate transporter-like MFS transporter
MPLPNPFAPAPPKPRLPEDEIRRKYPILRWQILESTFIGYATYYLVRNNLAVVAKDMQTDLGYTAGQIGDILAITAICYGIGKFVMGAWSDRSNPRTFMAAGLLFTALCNFAFGATGGYQTHLWHGLAPMRQKHGALVRPL